MTFTLRWLKDHLDTNATADAIAEKLTALGLEVESVTDKGAILKPFIVAEVLETRPHPNADRLKICTVNNGEGTQEVVCGAPNARAGIKAVLARTGTTIPDSGMVLKAAKIRGVDSNGMLCSTREMGLGTEHDGIIELPADAPVGKPVAEVLGLDDVVFDIAITPDRGDCLGVRGIARDLAAAGVGTLKPLNNAPVKGGYDSPVKVTIDDTHGCKMFVGRYFKGVKNGTSPEWLQQRLKAIGLRPISALVDITNYVTFDLGRPLHVYDAAKLHGNITVRAGRENEVIEALNGKTYQAASGDTLIADDTNPLGFGGIVGGVPSGCTESTTDMFLECAWFNPATVATTGRRHQIDSDARYRFERTADPAFLVEGAEIATRMVMELCGGEPSTLVIAGKEPEWKRSIAFHPEKVLSFGGVEVSDAHAKEILEALGFAVAAKGKAWQVDVPSWRSDVSGEADIVEEVLRVHGYDAIPATPLPKPAALPAPALNTLGRRRSLARRLLATRGMHEIYSWSFVTQAQAALFGGGSPALALKNPISSELSVMRPSMLPGLILAAGRNAARGFHDSALFEVRTQFHGTAPDQQPQVAAGIRHGDAAPKNIYGTGRAADAFDTKADALAVLDACAVPVDKLTITADAPAWYHPGKSGAVKLGPKVLATFGEIHPRVLKALDVEGPVAAFEVFLEHLPEPKAKATKARAPFNASDLQPVERDFAFVVKDSVTADDVIRAVRSAEKALISDVRLFDVYTGAGIEDGRKSLALMVTFQPVEKTMTDEEIELLCNRIVSAVLTKTGGTLRGAENKHAA
ncbi:MAG: phenylalanine--tRNA ligase subunit beta [Alphaproteobacteria bacterium]|nr:phenylalanine--tRNA ligase subunit beta [Alphaproteobacteria bacterium]